MPWHTDRGRIGELAAALAGLAGALATIALDVALLAQSEIAEVAEGQPGGSSSMPHKRNPARAVIVTATAHRAPGLVATLLVGRAAGAAARRRPLAVGVADDDGVAAGHRIGRVARPRDARPTCRSTPTRMRANLDAAAISGDPR